MGCRFDRRRISDVEFVTILRIHERDAHSVAIQWRLVFVFFMFIDYSYANVSLTVRREALRAGKALAIVARKSVKTSQAIIPLMP